MDNQLQSLDQVKATVVDMAIKFGPKLVVALIILIAGHYVGRWAGRSAGRLLERFKLEPPIRILLVRLCWVLVFGLFAIMALQNLGVELLPLIAGLGVAGAAVALAMQGVLGNAAAGLTIIFTQPFHVGDFISIVKEDGEVLDISLFATTLGHADKSIVVIPNRKIVGEILHNYGKIRQLDVMVGVAQGADVDAALEAIGEILRANARVLQDPAPKTGVLRITDFGVSLAVKPWVKVPDYDAAISEINKAILATFRARNIAGPVPQRDVRMLQAVHPGA